MEEHWLPLQPSFHEFFQPYTNNVQDVRTFFGSNIQHQQHQHHRDNYEHGFINNTPMIEDINTSMGGLCLSYNNTNNRETGSTSHGILNHEIYGLRAEDTMQRMHLHHTNNHPSMMMRELVLSLAMDRRGCQYLQAKIEEGNPEDVEFILSVVKDHVHQLMTPNNDLIKKIFQARSSVTQEQRDSIVLSIISDDRKLKHVCMDNRGYVITIWF
jgi:hypothetical protein